MTGVSTPGINERGLLKVFHHNIYNHILLSKLNNVHGLTVMGKFLAALLKICNSISPGQIKLDKSQSNFALETSPTPGHCRRHAL